MQRTAYSMIHASRKGILSFGACLFLVFSALCLAVPAYSQEEASGDTASKKGTTLMERFEHGGWVMYPITICSMALIWLTVDLWSRTSLGKIAPAKQVSQVQSLFRAGDYVGAYKFCKNASSPFADVTRVGLSFVGEGEEAVETAVFTELNKVNSVIQTRINYLSVLGVCTPMIGLTGTVTGMMTAFDTLGTSGVGEPSKLSAAIGEVLVATASGLFIAVPAFMFFYFLRNRLQGSMHHLQDVISALFRKMPYSYLKDAHVGEEEFYAAVPNWVAQGRGGAAATA